MDFHCDHNGGADSVENMRPICPSCNLSMGAEKIFEFISPIIKNGWSYKITYYKIY